MKRTFILLIVTILFASFAACKGSNVKSSEDSGTSASAQLTETPTAESTSVPTPVPEPELISKFDLACTSDSQIMLHPLNDGRLAIASYSEDNQTTDIEIYNIYTDIIENSISLSGKYTLNETFFDDDSMALTDAEYSGCGMILNLQLEEMSSFDIDSDGGVFSHDKNYYYMVGADGNLYRCNLRRNKREKIDLGYDLCFYGIKSIHPDKDIIELYVSTSTYLSTSTIAVVDAENEELISYNDSIFSATWCGDDSITISASESGEERFTVTFGNDSKGYQSVGSNAFSGIEPTMINGSSYAVCTGMTSTFYSLSDSVGKYEIDESLLSGEIYDACYLASAKCIAAVTYEENAPKIVIINPQKMNFESVTTAEDAQSVFNIDTELYEAYLQTYTGIPVSDELSEARDYADSLESKYGVKIFISSQCREPAAYNFTYSIETTDNMSFNDEAEEIMQSLEVLDKTLGMYPENFFTNFKLDGRRCGIGILLVGSIGNGEGIIGTSFSSGEWFNIAVDIRMDELSSIYCHEIWHSIEDLLSMKNIYITEADWNEFNPGGFEYYGDIVSENDALRWTLFGSTDEETYFIDSYSKLSADEDKARIMEYVMTRDDCEIAICSSPYLIGKLQIMCDCIRMGFDDSSWENVRWERFLGSAQN